MVYRAHIFLLLGFLYITELWCMEAEKSLPAQPRGNIQAIINTVFNKETLKHFARTGELGNNNDNSEFSEETIARTTILLNYQELKNIFPRSTPHTITIGFPTFFNEQQFATFGISPDNNYVVTAPASGFKNIVIFSIKSKELPTEIPIQHIITTLMFNKHNDIIAGTEDGTIVIVHDWKNNPDIQTYSLHHQAVTACSSNDEGKLLTGSEDKNALIFDTHSSQIIKIFGHQSPLIATALTTNNAFTLTKEGIIYIWDIHSGKQLAHTLHKQEPKCKIIAMNRISQTNILTFLDQRNNLNLLEYPQRKILPGCQLYGDDTAKINGSLSIGDSYIAVPQSKNSLDIVHFRQQSLEHIPNLPVWLAKFSFGSYSINTQNCQISNDGNWLVTFTNDSCLRLIDLREHVASNQALENIKTYKQAALLLSLSQCPRSIDFKNAAIAEIINNLPHPLPALIHARNSEKKGCLIS